MTKELSGELEYRIRYDIEHDLFHAQNIFQKNIYHQLLLSMFKNSKRKQRVKATD